MPPSGPIGSARRSELDDVEEYIHTRRTRRSQRAVDDHELDWGSRASFASQPDPSVRPVRAAVREAPEPRRRRDLMLADFSWSDAPRGRGDEPVSAGGPTARPTAARAVEFDARSAPAPEVLTRAWDDALEGRELATNVTSLDERRSLRLAGPDAAYSVADLAVPVEPAARRTVVITGHGHDRPVPRRGYDARVRRHERSGFKPDRVAMWAVLLGLALLLAAATSSHGAVLHLHHALQAAAH